MLEIIDFDKLQLEISGAGVARAIMRDLVDIHQPGGIGDVIDHVAHDASIGDEIATQPAFWRGVFSSIGESLFEEPGDSDV